jgi:cysteine desulfurase
LYIRHGLTLDPLISGGPQEHGLRAGTENVPAIAGFGLAAHLATAETAREQERLQGLKAMLWDGLRAGIQGIHLNGAWECSVAHTLSVSCEGVSGEAVMMALDLAGIAVSTGAACASGALEPSHVLEAMCCGRERCRGALRISMGYRTSTRDIEILLAHLPRVIARLRATS